MPFGVDFSGAGLLSAIRWAQIIAATGRPPAGGLGSGSGRTPTFVPQRPTAGGFGPQTRGRVFPQTGPKSRPTPRSEGPEIEPSPSIGNRGRYYDGYQCDTDEDCERYDLWRINHGLEPLGRRRGGVPLPTMPPGVPLPGNVPSDFEKLLRKKPLSEFEKLIRRKPLSDFERLLNRDFIPKAGNVAKTVAKSAVLARRVLTGAGALLYSAPVGVGSDLFKPRGQKQRFRRGRPPKPRAIPQPRAPLRIPLPATLPRTPSIPAPVATTVTRPAPSPTAPLPAPRPTPRPSPAAQPRPRLPRVAPQFLFLPSLFRPPTPRLAPDILAPNQPGRLGLTDPRLMARAPRARPSPLTQPQPSGGNCDCSPKRTRNERKRKCSNPRVSTKRETRGGFDYVTITRRIQCPSSRKKRR